MIGYFPAAFWEVAGPAMPHAEGGCAAWFEGTLTPLPSVGPRVRIRYPVARGQ